MTKKLHEGINTAFDLDLNGERIQSTCDACGHSHFAPSSIVCVDCGEVLDALILKPQHVADCLFRKGRFQWPDVTIHTARQWAQNLQTGGVAVVFVHRNPASSVCEAAAQDTQIGRLTQ